MSTPNEKFRFKSTDVKPITLEEARRKKAERDRELDQWVKEHQVKPPPKTG